MKTRARTKDTKGKVETGFNNNWKHYDYSYSTLLFSILISRRLVMVFSVRHVMYHATTNSFQEAQIEYKI